MQSRQQCQQRSGIGDVAHQCWHVQRCHCSSSRSQLWQQNWTQADKVSGYVWVELPINFWFIIYDYSREEWAFRKDSKRRKTWESQDLHTRPWKLTDIGARWAVALSHKVLTAARLYNLWWVFLLMVVLQMIHWLEIEWLTDVFKFDIQKYRRTSTRPLGIDV